MAQRVSQALATRKATNEPKLPLSEYELFFKERSAAMKRKFPDVSQSDIDESINKEWEQITPSEKQKYAKKVKKEMAKFRMMEKKRSFQELVRNM